MKNKKYFIGLDIGTDSVGYAVTYDDYSLAKFKGEPMWGVTVFDAAKQSAERRGFRSARRRLDRRQQRVQYIREFFAREIEKIDPDFYLRIKESHLFKEDKSTNGEYDFLKNELFEGLPYNKKYPTIHHLICELMEDSTAHDVRLIYIAIAWLVAHRGHFLNEVDKDNIENLLEFSPVYNNFLKLYDGYNMPWNCDEKAFANILKEKIGVNAKEKKFCELLFGGKKPSKEINEDTPYSVLHIIKALCGGKIKISDLLGNDDYSDISALSLGSDDEEFMSIMSELEEDGEILFRLKALYDWATLCDVLGGEECISKAKVEVYNQHKKDLANLKKFVKKYCKEKYSEIFRVASKADNYIAYSGHIDKKADKKEMHGASKEKFSDYLKKTLKNIKCQKEDIAFYDDMMQRLEINKFLPKQVDGDNRVIPYQLYWYELKKILDNASSYLDFLNEKDAEGLTVIDKILSVFEYRIPYFVGPLTSSDKSKFAWMQRISEGKIYPWNFDKIVDLDKSEFEFIRRMTNTCTYIPGEDVLPKNSLLYSKFEVLNEINNIKVNDTPITVEQKQIIYSELFMLNAKVTPARLQKFMISNGICEKDDVISGVDMKGSINSSLKVFIDFKKMFESGILSEKDAEKFIKHCAYSEDRIRLKKWISKEFPFLSSDDKKYLSALRYKNFGRLSEKLLCGINGANKETGEVGTVIEFMWNTNDNLMQILSEKYTFAEEIKNIRSEYFGSKEMSVDERLDEMYISNAVKRPILRTFEILKDIKSVMGCEPEKIFIEMARGATDEQKNKRTKSRKDTILELYKKIKDDDLKRLSKELSKELAEFGDKADNKLQSESLFLYFLQMGKCMYSGEDIDINYLKTDRYNIDHIYPRCFVKDDSFNNKVLVKSEYNGEKSDTYPVNAQWRKNMAPLWNMLNKNGLLSDEKLKRLTRSYPFTNEEKLAFINRQLVETRQSTKALAQILEEKMKNTKVVYVKAGLVSEFRHKYEIVKCRSVNDFHHAKDAYLNIVVGNVWNERFTNKYFSVDEKYSLNYDVVFGNSFKRGENEIWKGQESINKVIKITSKNNAFLTRYAYCAKGGLFDQMPVKASEGLMPRKKELPTEKYGGYNKVSASFFALVKYKTEKEEDVVILPVALMHSEKFLNDKNFATEYAKEEIKSIFGKDVLKVEFPLDKRIIKINTVFSVDGFKMAICGKSGGGKQLLFTSVTALKLNKNYERYIKKLDKFNEKIKKNPSIIIDEEYDEISKEKNIELYNVLLEKYSQKPFSLMKGNQAGVLKNKKSVFKKLSVEKQISVLINIISLLKTGRKGNVDLSGLDEGKNVGTLIISSKLSGWKSQYSDVRITDYSSTGIRKMQSDNLLKLL